MNLPIVTVRAAVSVVVTAAMASACGGSTSGSPSTEPTTTVAPTTVTAAPTATVAPASVDPTNFGSQVDNPWFPLPIGARWVYAGVEDQDKTRDVVVVTPQTRTIAGVACVVVRDDVFTNGRLSEHTLDYYAQDNAGSVWYFGEDTQELDAHGRVTSREGTWLTGRHGARPGVVMRAHPAVGDSYQQEYFAGHAEDNAKVVDVGATIHTPAVSSRTALVTVEWTPLEPKVREHKYYVRGIGQVKEDVFRGGHEVSSLVSYSGIG